MSWDGQRPMRGLRSMLLRPRWSQVDWLILLVALGLLGVGMVFLKAIADANAADERLAPGFGSHVKKVAVAVAMSLPLSSSVMLARAKVRARPARTTSARHRIAVPRPGRRNCVSRLVVAISAISPLCAIAASTIDVSASAASA